MPYAIQVLETGKPRQRRRWQTVSTAKRLTVAETILKSVRQDRLNVATLSRVRHYSGPLSQAYALAEG